METNTKNNRKMEGVVVSDKMQKTVVVEVARFVKHPKYGKFLKRNKRYKVHDEEGKAKMGDKVVFEPCRPISKDKHFKLVSIA